MEGKATVKSALLSLAPQQDKKYLGIYKTFSAAEMGSIGQWFHHMCFHFLDRVSQYSLGWSRTYYEDQIHFEHHPFVHAPECVS